MKPHHLIYIAGLLTALFAVAPSAAEAQFAGSVTAGIATPVGDAGDISEMGFTVQGRAELSILFAGLHANAGFTRLSGTDVEIVGETISTEALDLYNVGVGARVGLGTTLWAGANANYYFGADDLGDEFGLVPEVGASIGPIEAIADFKVTGDVNFWTIRAGLRF